MKRHAQVMLLLLLAIPLALSGFASPPEANPNPTSEKEDSEKQDKKDPDSKECANTLRWSTASEQQNFAYDVFRGPKDCYLPQRMYAVEHPTAGTVEMFLVPVMPDRHGSRFEAIFN